MGQRFPGWERVQSPPAAPSSRSSASREGLPPILEDREEKLLAGSKTYRR